MREQTAAYIIESKRSITQVAKEIGVNVNTLCRWVNDYRKRHNMPTYAVENGIKERMPKDEEELRARIKQLERQLKDKERELERQKKAAEDEKLKVEILKNPAHLHATAGMKYEAISRNSARFPVKKMCEVFGLHVTNYYRWKQYQKKREEKREQELGLVCLVESAFLESDKTYGYRAIKKSLEQKGTEISEYKIRKIMRENGFYPETRKKYKPYRKGKADGKYYRNLIQQNFKAEKRNQVWVGDITYLKTKLGWVYLAAVIDLYNREVIGYAVSKKIDTELVKRVLGNAIGRNGVAEGLVFHSDRGSQYASRGYQKMLAEHGIKGSMSKPGCPYDNASMESFFATLKKERIYRREYATMEEVKADMFRYIELFYNRKRLHSVLGYMSPVEYRLKYDGSKVA